MDMDSTSRQISHKDGGEIDSPPDSENEQISCYCRKLSGSKPCKQGASYDVHVSSRNILVTNSILSTTRIISYEQVCYRYIRGHIRFCMYALAIDLGFVTCRGLCSLCLIIVLFCVYCLIFQAKQLSRSPMTFLAFRNICTFGASLSEPVIDEK